MNRTLVLVCALDGEDYNGSRLEQASKILTLNEDMRILDQAAEPAILLKA